MNLFRLVGSKATSNSTKPEQNGIHTFLHGDLVVAPSALVGYVEIFYFLFKFKEGTILYNL